MLKCKFKGCRKSQYGEPFVFDSAHRAVITKTIKLVRKQSWEGSILHLFGSCLLGSARLGSVSCIVPNPLEVSL
jgi:hypothetical protein